MTDRCEYCATSYESGYEDGYAASSREERLRTIFRAGAEAMREAAAKWIEDHDESGPGGFHADIRALPLPEAK